MIVHFNQSLQTARTRSEGSRQTFAELTGLVVESLATRRGTVRDGDRHRLNQAGGLLVEARHVEA